MSLLWTSGSGELDLVHKWQIQFGGAAALRQLHIPPASLFERQHGCCNFQFHVGGVPTVAINGSSLQSTSLCSVNNNTAAKDNRPPRRHLHAAFGNDSSRRACRSCPGFNHAGRWVLAVGAEKANATAALLQALQDTIGAVAAGPSPDHLASLKAASVPQVEDHELLEWLPYTCQYQKITREIGAKCQQQLGATHRKVCFVGDSQTRHLYNQVVHLIEGPAARFRELITGDDVAEKAVLAAQSMLYVVDDHHMGGRAATFNSSNCSFVFANFGQWPLSYLFPSPWTPQQYSDRLQKIANHMQDEKRRYGNKQFWVTTPPVSFMDQQQQKGPHGFGVDWRTEPFLQHFNDLARRVMVARGIPVVDTWSIAAPLTELSYDGVHYLGTVGLAQARMVANIICADVLFGS